MHASECNVCFVVIRWPAVHFKPDSKYLEVMEQASSSHNHAVEKRVTKMNEYVMVGFPRKKNVKVGSPGLYLAYGKTEGRFVSGVQSGFGKF